MITKPKNSLQRQRQRQRPAAAAAVYKILYGPGWQFIKNHYSPGWQRQRPAATLFKQHDHGSDSARLPHCLNSTTQR
jgi:hypothetical protein